MRTATVTRKLQITLTRELKALGVKRGDEIQVSEESGRIIVTPLPISENEKLKKWPVSSYYGPRNKKYNPSCVVEVWRGVKRKTGCILSTNKQYFIVYFCYTYSSCSIQ